jgi:Rieske Fe-S protein
MISPSGKRTPAPDGRPACEQPAWRQEFPVDVPEDHYVSRRNFLRFLVLTSFAFVVGQVWILVQSILGRRRPKEGKRMIAQLKDLPVGGAKTFAYPGGHDSCILVRPDEERVLAYHQKCTHLSCAVTPDVAKGVLNCPCHHGVFDLETGRPLAGPARRPLPLVKLEVDREQGVIYAVDVEYRTV